MNEFYMKLVGHGDDMYRAAMKANPGVPDYDQKIYARY